MKKSAKQKDVAYTPNPILSLRLPMWRSKLVVFMLFMAFVALAARAFWIQGPGNAFFKKQGESRYQRTLELPATRGQIRDRNGLVLATSLPVKAIWAIPEAVPNDLGADKLTELAKLLDMTQKELRAKLSVDKTFVYVKRQVPLETAQKVAALDIPGIYSRGEYKRFYPEGEITAHLIGFTNIEDKGQEGVELGDQGVLAGTPGMRRVIKDRMGHIVEDVDEQVVPHNGTDVDLSIDSKIQYIAYTNLKAAVEKSKAKAGAAIVIDVKTGEVLALVNYPTYNPNDRSRMTGEQLRNRILTDTFEPGSIMKPFTVSLALGPASRVAEYARRYRRRRVRARRRAHHRRLRLRRADSRRRDSKVEQYRRDQDRDAVAPRGNVEHVHEHRPRPGAEGRLPGRGDGASAAVEKLAPHRAGDDVVWLRPVGVAVPACARLHGDRPRRRRSCRCRFSARRATSRCKGRKSSRRPPRVKSARCSKP